MKLLPLILLLIPLQIKEPLIVQFNFDFFYAIDTESHQLITRSPDTTVAFRFTDAQKNEILRAIDSLEVFSFPDTVRYLTLSDPRTGPRTLHVQTNKGNKTIIWYEIPDGTTPHLRQFVYFKNMLRRMVYQSDAYKALRRPRHIIN